MKEYASQEGGRYTYVDDIINLQELAQAINSIFGDCDNFVVSGCLLSGNTVSEGYVWLNGKLRKFDSSTVTANNEGLRYLVETNSTESVPYEQGGVKVGRNIFGVTLTNTRPTVGEFITIKNDGSRKDIKDAFFGKYSLLLNPKTTVQTVTGNLILADGLTVDGPIVNKNGIYSTFANGSASISQNGDSFTIEAKTDGAVSPCSITLNANRGIEIYLDNTKIATIGDTIVFNRPIIADSLNIGELDIKGSNIYNSEDNTNQGTLALNLFGKNGTTDNFRTTIIGDGKGHVMVNVDGQTNCATLNLKTLYLDTSSPSAVIIKGDVPSSDLSYRRHLSFQDSNGSSLGHFGYVYSDSQIMEIRNNVAEMFIIGKNSVNIYPLIKENGQPLESKYLKITDFNIAQTTKANVDEVYLRGEADRIFATKNGGLMQFISTTTTKEDCRAAIDAASISEIDKCAKRSSLLADMATDEKAKAQIRKNIGAVSADEVSNVNKRFDSTWLPIGTGLMVRQVGNIVNICGTLSTQHSGTVFILPNLIDPPIHTVGYSWSMSSARSWSCQIQAGQRNCEVIYCDNHNHPIPFNITYMV